MFIKTPQTVFGKGRSAEPRNRHRFGHRGHLLIQVIALALLLAGPIWGEGDAQDPASGITVLEEREGKGERCLVAGIQVHGDQVCEVRYQGRRFYVAAEMLEEFTRDPDAYFRQLQARSGLFDETALPQATPSNLWLILGLYVLAGLICGALCGYFAVRRGLDPIPWFFAGLAGNVAALFTLANALRQSQMAVAIPDGFTKVPMTRAPRLCPSCGGANHPTAVACAHCGQGLTPDGEAETARI